MWILLALVSALLLVALLMGAARELLSRDRMLANAAITNLCDRTTVDPNSGAMRSVQAADLRLSEHALGELWSAEHLERLARTYWRFLTRVTLGLIRVRYTEGERFVVLLFRPLTLLAFRAPEYELDADHGVVRWRIERGLLVARAGRESAGHLQIDVRRLPADSIGAGGADVGAAEGMTERTDGARLHIEVEVANFYPAIASGISLRLYNATQARIHVIVTHGFLRSLARLDLAESRVGRLAVA
ncbi:MAG TPA: hypothetical protein VNV42_14570 [Solirubrobacteraceae bacterium]|nr:hypothetical protein [Solirubrobacteraceae bacterium]